MVATGPLERETITLVTAREAHAAAVDGRHMHEFISSFNKLNVFTMVAHPVGMHHDFNRGHESLETRVTFSFPMGTMGKNDSLGIGGSLVGNQFVFAVLSHGDRTARRLRMS